jgi:hypothetical protein
MTKENANGAKSALEVGKYFAPFPLSACVWLWPRSRPSHARKLRYVLVQPGRTSRKRRQITPRRSPWNGKFYLWRVPLWQWVSPSLNFASAPPVLFPSAFTALRQCARREIKFVVYLKKKGWSRSEFMAACATPAATRPSSWGSLLFSFFCVNCLGESKDKITMRLTCLRFTLLWFELAKGSKLFEIWSYTFSEEYSKNLTTV